MEEDTSYLRFLINEDIYIIPEKSSPLAKESDESVSIKKEEIKLSGTIVMMDVINGEHFPEKHSELLQKIFGAVKIPFNSINILFDINNPNALIEWEKYVFDGADVFVFAKMIPEYLKKYLPQYQSHDLKGGRILLVHSLEELEDDKVKKTKLWNTLKQLYAIP